MSKPKILVAIPAYNCEKQIGRVLSGFTPELLDRVEKVIVVDNGSKDDTVNAAKKAAAELQSDKVEVWQNKGNYNLGGTHKVAFLNGEKLGMDYVAILHGDDQASTPELNNLIDVAEAKPEIGAILGCRFMKGSTLTGYDWKRIWGNRAINVAFSIVAMRPSKDLGSGLNLFRLSDLADHNYLGFDDKITFNIDLLLDYFKKKTTLEFVPISWREEDQVSNARNYTVGSTALKKLFRWRFNQEKRTPQAAEYYQWPSCIAMGMRGLQILMPMAGLGSRFAKAGHDTPKPLIEVGGLPMFRKALQSIEAINAVKTYHFVIRQEHVDAQGLDKLITDALPEAVITILPEMTRGAAETALAAKPKLNPAAGLVVMDCDLWFQSASYNTMVENSLNGTSDIAGGLLTFQADNPRYSYAKFGDDGIVTETAEKRVISDRAITGAYFFANAATFAAGAEKLLSQPLSDEMPEYYLSYLYNILIQDGKKIQAASIDQYASFGTPEELEEYGRHFQI